MSFLAPIAFAFAATIPVVVIFYLLKRKRVVKLISSTVLWQRFLADTQANAPFQRLRHNWLLVLQILLLILAVFALARPYFPGEQKRAELRVVILDASASMQATDVKPSRFERARSEALKLAEGLRENEQMMILLAGSVTEVKQSPTRDKMALRRALQACQPSDAPTRLGEALSTATAFTHEKRGEEEVTSGEIHLFSDGAIPDLGDFENKNLPLVYHRIGIAGNNVGIVSFDVKSNPENAAQRALFLSIMNPGSNTLTTDVELRFENDLVEVRTVTLPASNTVPLLFFASQSRDGVFSANLSVQDDLASDNRASVVSLLPKPAKVLLLTRGNAILEKALRAVGGITVATAAMPPENTQAYDIVVLDGVTPAVWPDASVLAIHVAPTNLFPNVGTVESPAIVDWRNTHPLLRFVNFDNVGVTEAFSVKAPPWGEVIVESPKTPLIVAGELNHRRVAWIGFDTLQSSWPLRFSFPIFIVNAMDWLNPATASASQFVVRAGDPLRISLPGPVTSAKVTRPDGTVRDVQPQGDGREIVFGDTARQGVYKLTAGTNEISFCANVMDTFESNITPRDEIPIGKHGAALKTAGAVKANKEIWRWLAGAGLFVLMFEWWFFHRRTA
jgi:Ca-activated chloride channel family protein